LRLPRQLWKPSANARGKRVFEPLTRRVGPAAKSTSAHSIAQLSQSAYAQPSARARVPMRATAVVGRCWDGVRVASRVCARVQVWYYHSRGLQVGALQRNRSEARRLRKAQ
jgi:hypothetical protein